MTKNDLLAQQLNAQFEGLLEAPAEAFSELTLVCSPGALKEVFLQLRDQQVFSFDQLMDVCGVDYLRYGVADWETEAATETGFSRGVESGIEKVGARAMPRFAVVYHLLSTSNNHRLRVKTWLDEETMMVPSVCDLWKSANWFEREAYDLYGILFEGHPDLRRILTDYGFIGHPFRKDFPISGHVEMRYDATLRKVIYAPVEIEPRVLVPKVIRTDNRYLESREANHG